MCLLKKNVVPYHVQLCIVFGMSSTVALNIAGTEHSCQAGHGSKTAPVVALGHTSAGRANPTFMALIHGSPCAIDQAMRFKDLMVPFEIFTIVYLWLTGHNSERPVQLLPRKMPRVICTSIKSLV